MGELRKFYSLATVVFVGRSLVDLGPRQHGSDMIEPAAMAKPVIVGPWTHNFSEAMARFSGSPGGPRHLDGDGTHPVHYGASKQPASGATMGQRRARSSSRNAAPPLAMSRRSWNA